MNKLKMEAVFITENPNQNFLSKLKSAARAWKIDLKIMPFTEKTISYLAKKKTGLFIVDSQESKQVGQFHRQVRLKASFEMPCLYLCENVILFDAGVTKKFDSKICVEKLGELLIKCIKIEFEFRETLRIYNEKYSAEVQKNFSGEEFSKAMDEARKQIFMPRIARLEEEDRQGANKLVKHPKKPIVKVAIPPNKRPNLGQMQPTPTL